MSMYRFGDDYCLNYSPCDALDDVMVDGWDKVERVEIDGTVFVNAGNNNRWYELFGTPEKAARTLENGTPMCDWCDTNACEKKGGECSLFNYDALLDWLMGESE